GALFENIAAYSWGSANLTQNGEPEELQAGIISANFFDTFGVAPAFGTTFLPDGDKGDERKVVVLSYGLWQRRFGGDLNIVGKSILLDGQSYSVIGIMPPTFQLLQTSAAAPNKVDIWIPQPGGDKRLARIEHNLNIIAKLKPGIAVSQGQAEVNRMAEWL